MENARASGHTSPPPIVPFPSPAISGSLPPTDWFETILPIAQAIITRLSPDDVLRTLVQEVRDLDGIRACAFFQYDDECSRLKVSWSSGLSKSYVRSRATNIPVGVRAVGKAFQSGDVVVVGDIDCDPAFAPGVRYRMHREGLNAVLAVPLVVQHRLLGILSVYFGQPFCPGEYDIGIILAIANLAGVALDNARLFQAQLRAASELREFSGRLREQIEVLRQTAEIHDSLARMVLSRDGLDAVTSALARFAHSTVLVEDTHLNVISVSDPRNDGFDFDGERNMLGLGRFQGNHRVRAHLSRVRKQPGPHLLQAIPEIGLTYTRITSPVYVGDDLLAFVSLISSGREFGPLDYTISEQGSIAMALELMKGKVALETEQRLRGDLLQNLLAGNLKDGTALAAASKFDLAALQRVMVIRPDESTDERTANDNGGGGLKLGHQIYDVVERLVTTSCPESIVVAGKECLTVLLAGEQRQSEAAAKDLARDIVSTVAEGWEPATVSIGISGPCRDLRDVARSFREASTALEIGYTLHKGSSTTSFSDLGVFEVLFRGSKPEDLREFAERYVGALASYDQRHGGSGLLQTLETYVRRNYSLKETAGDLFLHPNTVKYRLQKIEELCGVDLRNSEDSMNLQVALRLHRLIA